MEQPPKDAVAALDRLLVNRGKAFLRHLEVSGRDPNGHSSERDLELLDELRDELAALRWALAMAREMENQS